MISRRYLRIKVMQAIYAHYANGREALATDIKKLDQSISRCNELSYHFFSLFPEIKDYAYTKIEERKKKNFPTQDDLHPNTKFIDNRVVKQIEDSLQLQKIWNKSKIDWHQQTELIAKLFSQICELPEYQAYMQSENSTYNADKKIILIIIEKILAESTLLHWFFEEKYIHWFDDYNDALLLVYQNITFWKEPQEQVSIAPMFKEEEDITFYKSLYELTIKNEKEYVQTIEQKLKNWETDRIIETDMILMQMALCEIMNFPNIPVKVTINEYIEIAKQYGSEKSGTFINGLIDRIATDLRAENKLHKTGRGLLDKSIGK